MECQSIGPHNSKLHKIGNVFDSFKKKFNYINGLINNELAKKYDNMITFLQKYDYSIERVKKAKNEIEREIRTEYTKLIEDLRYFQVTKVRGREKACNDSIRSFYSSERC